MDSEDIREERQQKIARIMKYFNIIMAIFYFSLGISIAFLPLFTSISTGMRYLMGTLLLLYGAFRFYRAIKQE